MFNAHSLILHDEMKRSQPGEDAPISPPSSMPMGFPGISEEQIQMVAYYKKNLAFPAPPSICMAEAATVVLDPALPANTDSVPMSDLTTIGKLQLMVTDVQEAFPRFSELTGGRSIAALRVLGVESDGTVDLGSAAPRASSVRLLVACDYANSKRYIFLKDVSGKWGIPESSKRKRIVLAAEAAAAPHIDAMEGARTLTKPLLDGATAAALAGAEFTRPGIEATGAVVGTAWEATRENTLRGLEVTGAVVATAGETVGKSLQAANDAMAPAVAPAWAKTQEVTDKTLGSTLNLLSNVSESVSASMREIIGAPAAEPPPTSKPVEAAS